MENVCCLQSSKYLIFLRLKMIKLLDTDPCELPPNNGIGLHLIKRWYHNSALNKCEQFQYAGARGNENNFISKEICEKNCPRKN